MNIAIKTKTKKEYTIALAYLYAQGFKYDSTEFKDLDDRDLDFESYPLILLNTDSSGDDYSETIDFGASWYTGYDTLYTWSRDFDAIVKKLKAPKKIITMNLTPDYDAQITDDGIQVGCQTISFDKFNQLVELVKAYNED